MNLINNKSFPELCEATIKKMKEEGFSVTPGAIAKLFADILNKNIANFYETLTINHIQSFVTTASGEFLEAIGILLNCIRITNENDDDYRKRIVSQVKVMAKANETAIRFAILQVEGVEDVVLKRYSHGPGSFTVVPVINNKYNTTKVIQAIRTNVLDECSYGEKVTVKLPLTKKIKMSVSLINSINTTDVKKQNIAVQVREAIIKYVNSLKVGETLIINELTQRIMEIDENIINYSCNSFKINNKLCLYINQGARWDERFVISPDSDAITVA